MAVPSDPSPISARAAFVRGLRAAWGSLFALVMLGNYIGIGALAFEFGFSPAWIVLCTLLIWAAPAQVILISTLATASLLDVAIAVTLSSARFLPMVAALLPMLKVARTRQLDLVLPTHLTAISVWVEAMRLLPKVPREQRVQFYNGLGIGLIALAALGSVVGHYLAGKMPPLLSTTLLFFTPMAMLMTLARNSEALLERVAFGLGLVIGPLLAAQKIKLDLMWTGIIAGSVAYAVHRLRERTR
jgi:predicted branched-subunit amino acid permease